MNFLIPSKLDGIILQEEIDTSILKKILTYNKACKILDDEEIKKCEQYIRKYGSKKEINVKYNFGKGKKYGRVWSSISAGNFWNRIKSTIRGDSYVDIDMVNSGTYIIYQIGLKIGFSDLDMYDIHKYLTNRQYFLDEVAGHYKVGKSVAKDLFIIINFGGSVYGWLKKYDIKFHGDHLTLINTYTAQIKRISERLYEGHPELRKTIILEDTDVNPQGKILANVVQNIECRCLEVMYKLLGSPTSCSLEHDGLCVHKKHMEYLETPIEDLLKQASIATKELLYFDTKWIIKPFKEPFDLTESETSDEILFTYFDYKYFDELLTYEDKKKYFEIFISFVVKPVPVYIFVEFKQSSGKLEYDIWNENDIKKAFKAYAYMGKKLMGGKKNKEEVEVKRSFIEDWLDDTSKRIYNDYDFIPENRIEKPLNYWNGFYEQVYNSYNGYSVRAMPKKKLTQKQKEALLKPWQSIVFELCGADDACYNAYVDFLAHMIQKPNEKMPVCFILIGDQGTGKSYHLKPLQTLLDDYYISSSDIKNFVGSHANGFYRKLFINLNECQMDKQSFDYEGKIKSFITEDTIVLDEKFEKMKTVRNIARVVITTNKNNPIPIDIRSWLRRFQVFQSTHKYKNRPESWWKKEMQRVESDEFISTFYEFLNTRDISNIKITKPIITQKYVEMCKHFIPAEILFLEHFIECEESGTNFLTYDDNYKSWYIRSDRLYQLYGTYCERFGVKKEVVLSHHKFTLNITNLNIGIISFKKSGESRYSMIIKDLKNQMIKRNFMIRDLDDTTEEEPVDDNNYDNEFEDYENILDIVDSNTTTKIEEPSEVLPNISDNNMDDNLSCDEDAVNDILYELVFGTA
jgi:hypothetical protein